jgi:hypothetical protein
MERGLVEKVVVSIESAQVSTSERLCQVRFTVLTLFIPALDSALCVVRRTSPACTQTRQQVERFVFEVEVDLQGGSGGSAQGGHPVRPSTQEELEDALR